MKERVSTTVSPGELLQVHSSRGPIGQPITVPPGVTSVTITFKDTEGIKAAKARKAEKRGKAKRKGGAGGKSGGKPGPDED